jgi:hypothetical protein
MGSWQLFDAPRRALLQGGYHCPALPLVAETSVAAASQWRIARHLTFSLSNPVRLLAPSRTPAVLYWLLMHSTFLAIATGTIVLMACQGPADDIVAFDAPRAPYGSLGWLEDGRLIAQISEEDQNGQLSMMLVEVGPSELEPIDLPSPGAGCMNEGVGFLERLPDGRLGYTIPCDGDVRSLRALDLDTMEVEELARTTLRPSQWTFAPDLSRAMMASSSQICAQIVWLVGGEAVPADITVPGADGPTFKLSDQPLQPPDRCTEFARADLPAWSPDGGTIASFASPAPSARMARLA